MYEIFNMGLGMILAVSPEHVEKVQEALPEAFEIGRLVPRKTKAVILRKPYEDSCFLHLAMVAILRRLLQLFPKKLQGS